MRRAWNIVAALFLVGCSGLPGPSQADLGGQFDVARDAGNSPARDQSDAPDAKAHDAAVPVAVGYTHVRADGNRVASGRVQLTRQTTPTEVPLDGRPIWVVAASAPGGGTYWAVALEDGRTEGFLVDGDVTPVAELRAKLPAGMPPALVVNADGPRLLPRPSDASPLTHPVWLPSTERTAYIAQNGDLVLLGPDGPDQRLSVDALPDARLLVDEQERLLLLTDPTSRYDHGVLGDKLEAASVRLLATSPSLREDWRYAVEAPAVIEGQAPLWADLDGDGAREVVLTVSDASVGARLVVLRPGAAAPVAQSESIGSGYRWRHQLAVARTRLAGPLELLEVVTPHLGRSARAHQLQGTSLVQAATLAGSTSHFIGSRNLDMALCADVAGDAAKELLLVAPDRRSLTLLTRHDGALTVLLSLPLDGRLSTNLAATADAGGRLVLGAGLDHGALRLWR